MHFNESIDLFTCNIENSTYIKILYYYDSHLHSTFSKILTEIRFDFCICSNITDNVTAQCSLCAKRLHGQPHYQHFLSIIRVICLVCS